MDGEKERSIPRRQFVRTAVAIGGSSALAACTEREGISLEDVTDEGESSTGTSAQFPQGSQDSLPAGQHRWSQYLVRDSAGNTVPPQHQLILGLRYEGNNPPSEEDSKQVEEAFRTLERAFQWGTGSEDGATFNRGLLMLIGYAPSYFEATGSVPEELIRPERLLEQVGEDPEKTDGFDAAVILTSDLGSVVLAAEQALLGEKERLNGVDVTGSLENVFSVKNRRTGFAGQGIPADKLDQSGIPEHAPLSMGFKSGFTDSLPDEDAVTLRDGPFEGGTTLAMSRLRINLDRWYDQDPEDRVDKMFCPAHDIEEVGPAGTNLGNNSGIEKSDVENIDELAKESGKYGHAAKVARARDEDFEPRILRRSEGFATDAPDHTGFNFTGVQRDFQAFIDARNAMNVDEYAVRVDPDNHGIVDYIDTIDRGTYIVPPRTNRALPIMRP